MRTLLLAAFLSVPCVADEPVLLRIPVEPVRMRGCTFANGVIRPADPLPAQRGDEPLAVEAEAFASASWQAGVPWASGEEGAAGGYAVGFANELVYRFSLETPGTYTYRQRVRVPRRASWNHSVEFDGKVLLQPSFGNDDATVPGEWFWVEGGDVTLAAGTHTLAIRDLHNGKLLDRFVLSLRNSPPPVGEGPAPAGTDTAAEARFVGQARAPAILESWRRLACRTEGDAEVLFATPGHAAAPLVTGNEIDGRTGDLTVAIRLARAADGTPARVILDAAEYRENRALTGYAGNDGCRVRVDRSTGQIAGLLDPAANRAYTPDGLTGPLFELEFKAPGPGPIERVSSAEFRLTQADFPGAKAALRFELPGKAEVRIDGRFTRDDFAGTWTAEVRNLGDRDIIALRFPILRGVAAGGDGTDDTLCFPSMTGRLVHPPAAAGILRNIHPIRAAIGFCDVADPAGGVMLAPADFPMVLTEFASEPEPGGAGVTLSLTRRDRIPPGRKTTFTTLLGTHPGDWHVAADRYREWFQAHAGEPVLPDWVRDSDGWVTAREVEDMAGLGFNHMQWWGQTGYNACPTYYLPNPDHLSADDLRARATAWRDLGGHIGVYFHGNAVSRSYVWADRIHGIPRTEIPKEQRPPTPERFVRDAHYGPDGKPPVPPDLPADANPAEHEEYPDMCWQGGDWTGYLRQWALDVYLKDLGFDTPYWDTLGCLDAAEFNPHHGRNGEGRGAMARYDFLREMQQRGRRDTRGFYQIVEGGSELLGLTAGQLVSNFLENPEVSRYTHPEQIYYVGHSNGWWDPPKSRLSAEYAFVYNTKLDLIRTTPDILAIVRARRWLAPWLYRSRFLDRQGLELFGDAVRGAVHLHESRRGKAVIVTFHNPELKPDLTAVLNTGGLLDDTDGAKGFVVTDSDDPRALPDRARRTAGTWALEIPPTAVSAVLILERPGRADAVLQTDFRGEGIRLRIFDPAGESRALWARIETAEAGFETEPDLGDRDGRFFVTNADTDPRDWPATVFGRHIAVKDYPSLTTRRHADISVTGPGVRLSSRALVAPRFADPDFEGLEFSADNPLSGARCLTITPETQLRHFALELVPGRRYRVAVWVRREDDRGTVCANIHHHLGSKSHLFGQTIPVGEWTRISTTYVMPQGADQPHLYLYNWQGAVQPAHFDAVTVEDVSTEDYPDM